MLDYCVIGIVGCLLCNDNHALLVAQLIETFDYHSSAPTHAAQEKYRR